MKLFFDLLPIALFFVAYKLYDIYAATLVAIIASGLFIIITLLRGKRPDMMQSITFLMILVLGGMTLLFQNELFIKWKPTVVYWILALIFLIAPYMNRKNLVQLMLSSSVELPAQAWKQLNASWYGFFFIMGLLNIFVVYNFSTDIWVNFKLFGTLILTLIFVVFQAILISRYMPKKETE